MVLYILFQRRKAAFAYHAERPVEPATRWSAAIVSWVALGLICWLRPVVRRRTWGGGEGTVSHAQGTAVVSGAVFEVTFAAAAAMRLGKPGALTITPTCCALRRHQRIVSPVRLGELDHALSQETAPFGAECHVDAQHDF
ncbi:hypothetical protein [Novosphingobium sp. AP12]|uniref:hypothetical protein n=1 Tax=Novosphingobium sp. AP12 TaxID=1144305 RepID=UPI00055AAF2D|nr:hypothetical protein [Novosphingobium sp. AP12]